MTRKPFVHLHIVCHSFGIANSTGYAMAENSEVPANPPTTARLTSTSTRSHESSRAPAKSFHSETAATADNFGEVRKESLTATPTQLPGDTTSPTRCITSAGTQCRKAYTKEHLDAAALAAQKQAQNKDAFRGIANLTCKYELT